MGVLTSPPPARHDHECRHPLEAAEHAIELRRQKPVIQSGNRAMTTPRAPGVAQPQPISGGRRGRDENEDEDQIHDLIGAPLHRVPRVVAARASTFHEPQMTSYASRPLPDDGQVPWATPPQHPSSAARTSSGPGTRRSGLRRRPAIKDEVARGVPPRGVGRDTPLTGSNASAPALCLSSEGRRPLGVA